MVAQPQFRFNPLTGKLDLSDTAGGGGGGGGPLVSFYSYLSDTLHNVTGDSTVVNPVPFNEVTTNIGSGFNPSTGVFTAPFKGSYVFFAVIYLTNLSSGHTAGAGAFVLSNVQQYKAFDLNPWVVSEGSDLSQTCCSGVVDMNPGDTIQITLQVGPLSSKTVGIGGQIGISSFSGLIINTNQGGGEGILTVTGDSGGAVGADSNNNMFLRGSTHIAVDGTPVAFEQQILLQGFNQHEPVIGGLAGDLAQVPLGSSGDVYTSQGAGQDPIFAPPVSTSPLTTKGDTYGYTTVDARVPVGADGDVYTADSGQASGTKWAPPPASSPLTTKGDIYGYSNTNARKPVGADGYVLTADSGDPLGISYQPLSNTPNSVVFNPGKILTLVDDFICSYNGVAQDLSPSIFGQLNWDTFGGQWSAIAGTAANPGILTPTNGAFATIALDNFNNTDSFQVGAGSIEQHFYMNLVTLSVLGNRYTVNIGMATSGSFATNGISFQYADNVNSGNWQIVCTKQGVGTTTTNTSIAATTGYHDYKILVNSAGTSVAFYIDGILAGTIATANIPSLSIAPTVAFARTSGSLPAARLDLFQMLVQLTASRTGGTILPVGASTVQAYTATAVSYQVLITDAIIGVTSTASARTITMPNSGMTAGQSWTIKDESGGAATNNITVSGNGVNIDGAATSVIANNYGAIELYWNGSQFFII